MPYKLNYKADMNNSNNLTHLPLQTIVCGQQLSMLLGINPGVYPMFTDYIYVKVSCLLTLDIIGRNIFIEKSRVSSLFSYSDKFFHVIQHNNDSSCIKKN